MYENKWIFQGKVIKIIDGQTIVVWLDLGFELWKKVTVRFNRIRAKDYTFRDPKGPAGKFPDNDAKESTLFLENNLKGKKVVCQITKQPGYNGFDKYFAEIFGNPSNFMLKLKDININMKNPSKLEGYININDLLVNQGLYENIIRD